MYEEIEGEEEESSDADVGRDVVPVSDGVGIKDEERGREESGQGASELASPEEEKEAEKEGDERDRQAGPEENRIAVIAGDIGAGAVHEKVAERPLFIDAILPLRRFQGEFHIEEEER